MKEDELNERAEKIIEHMNGSNSVTIAERSTALQLVLPFKLPSEHIAIFKKAISAMPDKKMRSDCYNALVKLLGGTLARKNQ